MTPPKQQNFLNKCRQFLGYFFLGRNRHKYKILDSLTIISTYIFFGAVLAINAFIYKDIFSAVLLGVMIGLVFCILFPKALHNDED